MSAMDSLIDKENIHTNCSQVVPASQLFFDNEGASIICSTNSNSDLNKWQEQSVTLAAHCDSLLLRTQGLEKNKEALDEKISSLENDLNSANSKVAALGADHRAARARWAAEKAELEGRVFQLAALQTQLQGSLRKREQEFTRLQRMLVPSSTPTPQYTSCATVKKLGANSTSQQHKETVPGPGPIILTKPLPANSAQIAGGGVCRDPRQAAVLKDAEVTALRLALTDTQAVLESRDAELRILQSQPAGPVLKRKAKTVAIEENEKVLQCQLAAAHKLIADQRGLMHAALTGGWSAVISSTSEEDACDVADYKGQVKPDATTPAQKRGRPSADSDDDDLCLFTLPSVSPATLAVLRGCGWEEEELPPLAEAMKETAEVESCE